ncbi:MAG: cell shape determination protein CcmA [Betaproteobacteria bacterium HGW-Betaproteobacteria-12]|jgi:cytoskeletal protein CcmA (bactofilin family)|nr:MAG: cell shape determination protein CcmA [Betaproteobacteria bacterium HGW-Betaproteobacteria-12]
MFSKPILTNRNDVITRKDVKSVLGSPAVADIASENTARTPTSPPVAEATKSELPPPVATENLLGARLIVGPDVKLKGAEILDCDTLVVEGRVEATMDSRVIRIADQGSFAGKVSIDIAEIHGIFEGELTARSQLIIHATGKVSGKIRYGKLVIDEGGELCGDINSLSADNRPTLRPATELIPTLNAIAG